MAKKKTREKSMSATAKDDASEKPILDVPQTAIFLGVSQSLIWSEIKKGTLKPLRLGDRVLFSRVYLERLCESE
jgi:predicted DNA-binding transcriptional regulator AlpA